MLMRAPQVKTACVGGVACQPSVRTSTRESDACQALHRLVVADLGALVHCQTDERVDAPLGSQIARARLPQRHFVVGQLERRVTLAHFGGIQQRVLQPMLLRARQGACHHAAVGRADHQAAAQRQQADICLALQLCPQLVRAPQQRHVVGVLEIGQPDDARLAVRRARAGGLG